MVARIGNKFAGGVAIVSVALASGAIAQDMVVENTKKHALVIRSKTTAEKALPRNKPSKLSTHSESCDEGKGNWKLKSSGGLSYVNPDSDAFWFKLSGALRFDETLFMGSTQDKGNDFPSGGTLRAADLYLDGGVGKDWEYKLQMAFNGNSANLTDTYIAYSGLMQNNQVFVGRISGNWFGLDGSNSTSWNPFLERSMIANAFYPGDGLGIMTDFWGELGGITLAAMQPDQSSKDMLPGVRDRWKGTIRGTLSPVHESGDVWHFGASGAYREMVSTYQGASATVNKGNKVGSQFKANPSARARNTASLLDTGLIQSNYSRSFNLEFARQYQSLMVEAEYTNAFIHRVNHPQGNLNFDGWNLQTRYLLTGEVHAYDVRDGNFGSLKPQASYGAVEIAARYDFLNLNNKDVQGGSEHNVTLGLNWYLNDNVRLSANYIRASIHPGLDALKKGSASKRHLDILGMRCQLRFK